MVLTIITVAAGLIVPRMGSSTSREELHEAAGRFAHTARTVRELAVSIEKQCAIEIDLDHGAYAVAVQSSEPGGKMKTVQASWLKHGRWPASIRVADYRTPTGTRTRSGTETIDFFSDGTSSGAAIRLTDGSREYTVVVHAHSGRVVFGDARTTRIVPDQLDLGD